MDKNLESTISRFSTQLNFLIVSVEFFIFGKKFLSAKLFGLNKPTQIHFMIQPHNTRFQNTILSKISSSYTKFLNDDGEG